MSDAPKKQESPFTSILVNVLIPVTVLSFLSKDKYLGPVWGLVVALIFPIGYGTYSLIKAKKADFMSLIGIISVLLTGVFGILKLPPEYIAIKEAAVPLIIGIAIVGSLKTPWPLIKKLMMTEALFDVERLQSALKERAAEAVFEKRLVGLTWGFASSMFLSSGLNYALAKIVLKSEPGTEAFTAELGKMTGLGHVVILIPCMIVMIFVFNKLINTLQELTGLGFEELLAEQHRKKTDQVPPVEPAVD